MRLTELSTEERERLERYGLDWLHEKREFWPWEYLLSTSEFLSVQGYDVLLPVPADHHPNIIVERLIAKDDMVVLYLRDTTIWDRFEVSTEADEDEREFHSCFLAVCVREPEIGCHIAVAYHQCLLMTTPQ
jgi:hypothetical protein